jgi:hypothetical protein
LRWDVHDELGVSARSLEEARTLKEAMEEPFAELKVAGFYPGGWFCPVSVGTGRSWADAKG